MQGAACHWWIGRYLPTNADPLRRSRRFLMGTVPSGKLRGVRRRQFDFLGVLLVLAFTVLSTAAVVWNRASHAATHHLRFSRATR